MEIKQNYLSFILGVVGGVGDGASDQSFLKSTPRVQGPSGAKVGKSKQDVRAVWRSST